jgi:penicillin-binding protein 1C
MGSFAPKNYNRGFEGAVPAFRALARSLNVPAVRMLHLYGVDRFYDLLLSLGLSTLFRPAKEYGLSLILGGAEGTLWDLTAAYAYLARCAGQQTSYIAPYFQLENNPQKRKIARRTAGQKPLSAQVCRLTLSAMQQVTRPGEEQNWEFFTSSQKIAWKTGTSFGFRDGWAIGVTPEYAVGVWVGNADGEGRPGLTGISTAAPILFDLFDLLESPTGFVNLSDGLVEIDVCAQSGYRAGPHCEAIKSIKAPPAGRTGSICPFCRTIHCDAAGEFQVNDECQAVADMKNISWFVLPPTMEWFYRQKHTDYKPLPPFRADCQKESSMAFMSLIRQNQGGAYFVPVELEGESGRIVFEAAHRKPGVAIYWHLDDQYLTATRGYHQISIAPPPGEHVLTLVDELGERLVNRFTVLAKDKN